MVMQGAGTQFEQLARETEAAEHEARTAKSAAADSELGIRVEDWEMACRDTCFDLMPQIKAKVRARAIARNRIDNARSDELRTSGGSASHRD